jgi:hypothetical protein
MYGVCNWRYSLEDTGSDAKTLPGYLWARARDAASVEPLLYIPKPMISVANI